MIYMFGCAQDCTLPTRVCAANSTIIALKELFFEQFDPGFVQGFINHNQL